MTTKAERTQAEIIVDLGSCLLLATISITLAVIAVRVSSWMLAFLAGWIGRAAVQSKYLESRKYAREQHGE